MTEDQLTLALVQDKIRRSAEQYTIEHTGFLDLHRQSLVKDLCMQAFSEDIICEFQGGYEGAQRQMMICRPSFIPFALEEHVAVLRLYAGKEGRHLSHRDYLGALLGTGISRSETGDILVREDGADILVTRSISRFLSQEFVSAGSTAVKREILPPDRLILPEQRTKNMHITVSSLRIDSLVAAIFGMARSRAGEAVRAGRVFVDGVEILKPEKAAAPGQTLVLRGEGKARLIAAGKGKTKKGRIGADVEKYL